MSQNVVTGTVAFQSLDKTDVYNGMDTGKYNVTLSLDADSASQLEGQGVNLKDYEGNKQRKFASKYQVDIFDAEGKPFNGLVTRGSKVKVKYSTGKPHPVHGVSPYLVAVKVLELAEAQEGEGAGGDF
jgi:hypothetical protein